MTERHISEEPIFLDAIQIDSEVRRRAYLDRACGDDQSLRSGVEALLAAHAESGDLLDVSQAPAPTVDLPRLVDQPGSVIGPYKLLQEIGEGGMGVVFLAEQVQPVRRRVALKIVKPGMDSRHIIARFEAERQALAMMEHPNVARVLDAGATDAGRPYFVMELVKGIPITRYCDQNHLTTRARLKLFAAVCHAVQHAHHKGIIHRDLKPSNVLVAEYDDLPVPKVIDFGVAKALNQSLTDKTMFTQLGQVVGTMEYMSPEQAKFNQLDVDTRSDIYSLGVLLYELLTGDTPLEKARLRSTSYDEIIRIIGEEEPLRPSDRLQSSDTLAALAANRNTEAKKLTGLVRGELDWIVMRALEKDRTRRYETASALAADIERYLNDQPVEACPPSVGYQLRKFLRRHRTALSRTVATVVIVSLAMVAVTFGWKYFSGQRQLMTQQTASDQQQQAIEQQRQRERQAREVGIPEIRRLVAEKNYVAAYALAADVEDIIPNDPTLAKLRAIFAHDWSVETYPAGADVYWKDYDRPEHPWQYAGRTPIEAINLPREMLLWKVSRDGFEEVIGCRHPEERRVAFTLDKTGDLPAGMVRVSGNFFHPSFQVLNDFADIELDDFYIDRYEVTNRQFKEFVDAGGYENREYWDAMFESGQGLLTWDEVVEQLVDESRLPGPATWRDGAYPEGKADYPVCGVSWYEAAAYARFVGKELPSVVHWLRANSVGWNYDMQIAGQSHVDIKESGPVAVGSLPGVGPFGTYDAAGNITEWCVNSGDEPVSTRKETMRVVLGGAWDADLHSCVSQMHQSQPLAREPTHGFRCVKYLSSAIPPRALAPIRYETQRDLLSETPVNDEMYELCRSMYARPKSPLNAEVISSVEEDGFVHEVVEIDAAYGGERFAIHLMLPQNGELPYQPVLYFPGMGMFKESYQGSVSSTSAATLFLVKSGRVSVRPVFDGSAERFGRSVMDREWVFHVFSDLTRTIDYLETRTDMDTARIGYLGLSLGSFHGPAMLAMEDRIRAATLTYGGLAHRVIPPVHRDPINFAPRVTIPVLMVNGRDDYTFPVKTSQAPLYHFLGSPAQNKTWIVLDGGHTAHRKRQEWKDDAVAWFDQHLGPVGKQSEYVRVAAKANFAALRGDWAEAAKLYSQAAEVEQRTEVSKALEGLRWMQAAVSLLMADDEDGYRKLCAKMIVQFAGREEPWICERVLKTCLVCPRDDVSSLPSISPQIDALAGALDAVGMPERRRPWASTLALWRLRSGDAEQALRWADSRREGEEPTKEVEALRLVISALAKQKLARPEGARVSLSRAAKLIDANLPKSVDGSVDPHSAMRSQRLRHDWLIAELLRSEAEQLFTTIPVQSNEAPGDSVAR